MMNFKTTYLTQSLGALLLAPMWVAAQTVTGFTVVNADTGAQIATPSGLINLNGTLRINVRAETAGNVGSVDFALNGINERSEKLAPYALKGDTSGNYNKWSPDPGTYDITATPSPFKVVLY